MERSCKGGIAYLHLCGCDLQGSAVAWILALLKAAISKEPSDKKEELTHAIIGRSQAAGQHELVVVMEKLPYYDIRTHVFASARGEMTVADARFCRVRWEVGAPAIPVAWSHRPKTAHLILPPTKGG